MNDIEKDLWTSVYKSVIHGLYLHDKSDGIEHYEAKREADIAIDHYRAKLILEKE